MTERQKDDFLIAITRGEISLKEIEDRLRSYVPEDVAALLSHVDKDGNTALHLACRLGNFELARILLSHKAATGLKNKAGLLAVQCVAADNKGAKIAALIAVINKRREAIKMAHIDVDRTVFLIEEAQKHISSQVISGKSPVIILGNTRKGKSTFINYLLRESNYRIVRVGGSSTAQPEGEAFEPVRVGRTMLSETLYPSQFEVRAKDYSVVDMPGFEHNFGSPEKGKLNPYDISAGFATDCFLKRFSEIRATVLVIEWSDLLNHNIGAIREALMSFAGMMGNTEAVLANSLLVITKPNLMADAPTTETIREVLATCREQIQQAMRLSGCDAELIAKIDRVLGQWLGAVDEHVFVGDIRTNACRDAVHDKLSRLRPVARKHYQFQDYSAEVKRFKEVVDELEKVTDSLRADSEKVSGQLAEYEKRRLALSNKTAALITELKPEADASLTSLESSIKELESLCQPTQALMDEANRINWQVKVSESLARPDLGREGAGVGAARAAAGAGAGAYSSGLFSPHPTLALDVRPKIMLSFYWQLDSLEVPESIYVVGINGDWSLREEHKLQAIGDSRVFVLKRAADEGVHNFKYVEKHGERLEWLPSGGSETNLTLTVSEKGATATAYHGEDPVELGVIQVKDEFMEELPLKKAVGTPQFYFLQSSYACSQQRLFKQVEPGGEKLWYPYPEESDPTRGNLNFSGRLGSCAIL